MQQNMVVIGKRGQEQDFFFCCYKNMQNFMRNTISLKQKIQSLFLTFLPLGSCGELLTQLGREQSPLKAGWSRGQDGFQTQVWRGHGVMLPIADPEQTTPLSGFGLLNFHGVLVF